MRKLTINEIDSNCYTITTQDFSDGDAVQYHWDQVTRTFWSEYLHATMTKSRFEREYFSYEDCPTIGAAIDFIMRREKEMCDAKYQAMINMPVKRVVDRIVI